MFVLYDSTGYKNDFGSSYTVRLFRNIARKLVLKELLAFLTNGFTINKDELINDLENINFNFSEYEELVNELIDMIEDYEDIVILTNELE